MPVINCRQQDTIERNPAYGTISPTSQDTEPPPAIIANTSATPPIYATISEKTSKKQNDGVSNENIDVLEDKEGEGGGGEVEYQVNNP